ncbi:MAG: hypothetical protein RL220_1843, partial [Bacteroidota bacterium]
TEGSELGTEVLIEGSKIKGQSPAQCPKGTTIEVKNLFFNVPARRYFLKSDQVELRHIIDEFERVAIPHYNISFTLSHNGSELLNLPKTALRQRIVHVFGSKYNEKLVPVEEETAIVNVSGFVGKPDAARKTRGEQFFFVNNRFIRNSYLHHAVMSAYEELLPSGYFPLYFVFLEIDPAQIDINIHPTKTEIKFQDERAVYSILHAGIRRALGRHNISPVLDFNQDMAIQIPFGKSAPEPREPGIAINPAFNPFTEETTSRSSGIKTGWQNDSRSTQQPAGWEELFEVSSAVKTEPVSIEPELELELDEDLHLIQFHRTYIFFQHHTGTVIVHQQRAHERILYEQFLRSYSAGSSTQKLLFPEEAPVSSSRITLLAEWIPHLKKIGWECEIAGESVVITGVPSELTSGEVHEVFHRVTDDLFQSGGFNPGQAAERIAQTMARHSCLRKGQMLTNPEMTDLLTRLFDCDQPYFNPSGKPVMITLDLRFLEQTFR